MMYISVEDLNRAGDAFLENSKNTPVGLDRVTVDRVSDSVVEPSRAIDKQEGGGHYKDMAIQPVEYIHGNNIPFIEGCVIKYVSRWRNKNGIEDLKKAKHFLELLIELENNKESNAV